MSQGMNMVSWRDYSGVDGFGQTTSEALYVGHLIIDAGATLNTNGAHAYQSLQKIAISAARSPIPKRKGAQQDLPRSKGCSNWPA